MIGAVLLLSGGLQGVALTPERGEVCIDRCARDSFIPFFKNGSIRPFHAGLDSFVSLPFDEGDENLELVGEENSFSGEYVAGGPDYEDGHERGKS